MKKFSKNKKYFLKRPVRLAVLLLKSHHNNERGSQKWLRRLNEDWRFYIFYANEELKKIVKRLKKKTTEDEFIETRVIPILEREEKARIKNFKKIYGRNMPKWHIEILNMSIFLKCNRLKCKKREIAL